MLCCVVVIRIVDMIDPLSCNASYNCFVKVLPLELWHSLDSILLNINIGTSIVNCRIVGMLLVLVLLLVLPLLEVEILLDYCRILNKNQLEDLKITSQLLLLLLLLHY